MFPFSLRVVIWSLGETIMYVTTINKSGKILGAGVRIQIMDQNTTIIEGRRGGKGFNSKNLRNNWIFPKKNTMKIRQI